MLLTLASTTVGRWSILWNLLRPHGKYSLLNSRLFFTSTRQLKKLNMIHNIMIQSQNNKSEINKHILHIIRIYNIQITDSTMSLKQVPTRCPGKPPYKPPSDDIRQLIYSLFQFVAESINIKYDFTIIMLVIYIAHYTIPHRVNDTATKSSSKEKKGKNIKNLSPLMLTDDSIVPCFTHPMWQWTSHYNICTTSPYCTYRNRHKRVT